MLQISNYEVIRSACMQNKSLISRSIEQDLTIVVPVYNEEGNLERAERELIKFVRHTMIECHILFVDDGSTDHSLEIIEQICGRNERFSFLA